jgi:hypothetical protein
MIEIDHHTVFFPIKTNFYIKTNFLNRENDIKKIAKFSKS